MKVDTHDLPDREPGKAIPYGVYDLTANTGWVNVGTDHDTAAFAVASIRHRWASAGGYDHPNATRLLLTADAGGSNGYRTRAWKTESAALAEQTGPHVTVCHMPPGTSKWNKMEHRLFSAITMNWRGRPLNSHEVIVNSIAAATTRTGPTVHAELDPGSYPTGVEISDAQLAAVPSGPTAEAVEAGRHPTAVIDRHLLRDPEPTGMSGDQLEDMIRESAGPQDKPTPEDRVLATILHLRKLCTHAVLGQLFSVDRDTVTRAVNETRPLLEQHGYVIIPSTARFPAPNDLIAFPDSDTEPQAAIEPAC